ncbi:copper resistance CopC family protein [Listeria grayi]|uniref:copper resistance CopC family protein n=1 Tax=Listeria grayi TaxID=1641 RepID=UPI00362C11FC
MEVGLKSNLKPDVYTASWRVVSADGHPVQGQIAFKLGKTDQAFQQADTGSNTSQTVVSSLQKIILYIGFCLRAHSFLLSGFFGRKREMPDEVRRAWHRLHIGAWLFTGVALLLKSRSNF